MVPVPVQYSIPARLILYTCGHVTSSAAARSRAFGRVERGRLMLSCCLCTIRPHNGARVLHPRVATPSKAVWRPAISLRHARDKSSGGAARATEPMLSAAAAAPRVWHGIPQS